MPSLLRSLVVFTVLSVPLPPMPHAEGPPTLEGSVVDLGRGIAIEDVTVTLVRSRLQVATDGAGQFSFESTTVAPNDTLVVTHPDFIPVRIALGVPPDEGWRLRIQLLANPVRVENPEDSVEVIR